MLSIQKLCVDDGKDFWGKTLYLAAFLRKRSETMVTQNKESL